MNTSRIAPEPSVATPWGPVPSYAPTENTRAPSDVTRANPEFTGEFQKAYTPPPLAGRSVPGPMPYRPVPPRKTTLSGPHAARAVEAPSARATTIRNTNAVRDMSTPPPGVGGFRRGQKFRRGFSARGRVFASRNLPAHAQQRL